MKPPKKLTQLAALSAAGLVLAFADGLIVAGSGWWQAMVVLPIAALAASNYMSMRAAWHLGRSSAFAEMAQRLRERRAR